MNGIVMMGMAQPQAGAVYEQVIESGNPILPDAPGKYTLFSLLPIYSKNSRGPYPSSQSGGENAHMDYQAVWIAADEVAFKFTQDLMRKAVLQAQAQQKLVAPQKGLVLPQ